MKKYLWIIMTLSVLSCKQNMVITNSNNYNEFYSALNALIKSEYPNAKMIVDETLPVFRNMYGNYPRPEIKEDEPPPPPPPGIIYFDKNTFQFFVLMDQLDSTDANFMYQSIDSTKKILLDPLKINLKVIEQEKIQEIWSHKTELISDKWKEFREIFGDGCFLRVSTPISNSDLTKLIITIQKICGPPDGEESTFIIEKSNNKWRLVESKYDITTDP